MSTSAALLTLLNYQADINYYTTQQIYWGNLQSANEKKLTKQEKYKTTYDDAYNKALDNESSGFKYDAAGHTVDGACSEAQATIYAEWKAPNYDEDVYDELYDLDVEYDTMKTMYDTLLEEKQAQYDSLKEKVSQEAQDTNLLGS